METEQFSLCWNNFHNNLRTGFHSLLKDEDLVDVTLAAEGRFVKAHKTVLSICSPYFKELFKANPCKHPIVILQDVKYNSLTGLLQFMYQGEVSVSQDEIPTFMRVAELLKVKGLTESSAANSSTDTNGISDGYHRNSPYMYGNSDSRQAVKRPRPVVLPTKKIIRPLQQIKSSESPKTVSSPMGMSPHSVPSPQPSPAKKPCIDERQERLPEYVDSAANIKPKQEPVDHDDDDDDYGDDDEGLDVAAMLDTTLSESSHASSGWTPDVKMAPDVKMISADASSPGTLQCILGKRGNPRLIVDGHVFFKKSTYKGKSFWYCKHSRTPHKCPAVCWTLHGQIVKWPGNHSHMVIPEPFNPDEDVEVPINRLADVLLQSSFSSS